MDSIYDSLIHLMIKFDSKYYSISIFSWIFYLKDYSIICFSRKINSKIWIWLYSIQQNIHSIKKPKYRPPPDKVTCIFSEFGVQNFKTFWNFKKHSGCPKSRKSLENYLYLILLIEILKKGPKWDRLLNFVPWGPPMANPDIRTP